MKQLIRHPYFYPAITTILFVLAIFIGVLPVPKSQAGEINWVSLVSKALLALGFLLLSAWFLHAFTHADRAANDESCQAEQRASMFRFAYMFSAFSFALLMLPFTAMLRSHETPPDAGPIRLLRACVDPPVRPASGVASPVDLCPVPMPSGTVSYPWLVSVGGVVAQECGTGTFKCSEPIVVTPSGAVPASAGASTPSSGTVSPAPPMYSVKGGFVVPFYVVVFSFIGGVVNLTRRIPEYQKRASCDFLGTPTETPVTLLEAREFVVFQIMQLISSPFVAMVGYYALEPKSIASAVGLAFVSGFATESVLLLIRGMVSGLRPETTKTTANSLTTAQLHVLVRSTEDIPINATKVELRSLPNAASTIKVDVVDDKGEIVFKGLAPGTVWVVATLDLPANTPAQLTATQKVNLKMGQTESVEIILAKPI